MTPIIDSHISIAHNTDVSQILRSMDTCGVEMSIISPDDGEIATNNVDGNRRMERIVSNYPTRFASYAVSNPWFGKAAQVELRRAFNNGALAFKINSNLQGFMLFNEIIDPLIDIALEFSAPIYCHTGTPINALPLQLGVLAKRHSNANFIMGRCGRTDFRTDAIPVLLANRNVYADTSHDYPHTGLKNLMNHVGAERMIFSSDYPYEGQEFGISCINEMEITLESKIKILGLNILQLLPAAQKDPKND